MNWNLYEHEKMKDVKEQHPDWIWNRADTHVILGTPGCLEAYKIPVEPGNSFSPGVGTYGVSSWIFVNEKLHAPEEKELSEFVWKFERGYLPLLHSRWKAGEIEVHTKIFPYEEDEIHRCYYSVEIKNTSDTPQSVKFYLAIRSFGAAGGPVRSLKGEKDRIWVNGVPVILADQEFDKFGAVSYQEEKRDISQYAREGKLPQKFEVEDSSTWASGAAEYSFSLGSKETAEMSFGFTMHADHWLNDWMEPQKAPLETGKKEDAYLEKWEKLLNIGLDLPDQRFSEAFQCQLAHLYMFTVDSSIRITPVSYPLWWLRDGAYVLNALNRGGFHEFSERALREIASKDAFGGFGSEGDGPSDGIWMLTEHYLLTRDKEFLEEMYPHIQRKAELLMKMRRADRPVRKFTEFVIPKCMLDPNIDLMCLPAEDGLIMGRMDHGIRVFWVNGFAYLALKRAAFCARELGYEDSRFEKEAENIKDALLKRVAIDFGKDDRDVNSAFWPAAWADPKDQQIRKKFQEFWDKVRCPGGIHSPEKEWTYFEGGQAHNYLLLGDREKAWVSIEWFLSHHTAPGLYTYPEAIDGNTSLLWPRTRGWDDTEYVTPHGWTAAEVFHLLRDCLVREKEGTLVIGSGIPYSWKDETFSVSNIPTYFGRISFVYAADKQELTLYISPEFDVEVTSELPFEAAVRVIKSQKGENHAADYVE